MHAAHEASRPLLPHLPPSSPLSRPPLPKSPSLPYSCSPQGPDNAQETEALPDSDSHLTSMLAALASDSFELQDKPPPSESFAVARTALGGLLSPFLSCRELPPLCLPAQPAAWCPLPACPPPLPCLCLGPGNELARCSRSASHPACLPVRTCRPRRKLRPPVLTVDAAAGWAAALHTRCAKGGCFGTWEPRGRVLGAKAAWLICWPCPALCPHNRSQG